MAIVLQNEVAALDDGKPQNNHRQSINKHQFKQDARPIPQHPAERFLSLLDPISDRFCFRTFDDTEQDRRWLAKKFDGSFGDCQRAFEASNNDSAGVFVVINKGGHTADSIVKVRAVFADTDGAPLEPLRTLDPHAIVQSSLGKWHVYWLVEDDFPVNQFSLVQKAIAAKFGTDPSINDLSRVMRLPGFKHCKNAPVDVRIAELNDDLPRYTLAEIVEGLGLELAPMDIRGNDDRMFSDLFPTPGFEADILEGGRNSGLLSYVGKMRAGGVPEPLITQIAMNFNLAHCKPPLEQKEVLDVVNRYAGQGNLRPDTPDGRIQFTDILPPQRNFTIRNLLMAGKSAVLAGLGGVSKTQLAIQAAVSVATGRDFLGRKTHEGSVLMLLGEEDSAEISRRFNATAVHLGLTQPEKLTVSKRLRAYPMTGVDMRLAKNQGGSMEPTDFMQTVLRFADEIEQSSGLGLRLIVLDHVGLIHGGDFNAREDVVRTVSIVNDLADKTGAAVILLAHSPKASANSDEPSATDVAGSASWVDNTRASFILKTMTDDEAKKYAIPIEARKQYISLSSVKGNYIPPDQKLWMIKTVLNLYETTVLDPIDLQIPAKERAGTNYKLRQKILNLVAEKTYLTRNKLESYAGRGSMLGESKDKVRAELDSMLADGLLTTRPPSEHERRQYQIRGKTIGILTVCVDR